MKPSERVWRIIQENPYNVKDSREKAIGAILQCMDEQWVKENKEEALDEECKQKCFDMIFGSK